MTTHTFTAVERLGDEITRFSIAPKPVPTPSAPKMLKRTRSSVLDYDYYKTEMLKSQDSLNAYMAENPPPLEFRRLFETFVNNYAHVVKFRDAMYEAEKAESDRLHGRCVALCQDINELTMHNKGQIQENIERNAILVGKLQKTKDFLEEKTRALQNSIAREQDLINQVTELRMNAVDDNAALYDLSVMTRQYEDELLKKEELIATEKTNVKYHKSLYDSVCAQLRRNMERLRKFSRLEGHRISLISAMNYFVKTFKNNYFHDATVLLPGHAGSLLSQSLAEIDNIKKLVKEDIKLMDIARCVACNSFICENICDNPHCRFTEPYNTVQIIDVNTTVPSDDEDEIVITDSDDPTPPPSQEY